MIKNSIRKYSSRFYKNVSIVNNNIKLDNYTLKTPSGNIISANPLLLHLMAGEYESLVDISSKYLPLTSIVIRSIDDFSISSVKTETIEKLLKFLHTDSTLYHQTYPQTFYESQQQYWISLSDYLKNSGIPVKTTDGLIALTQDSCVIDTFRKYLHSLDNLQLAAFERACLSAKSFIIAYCLLNKRISVEFAVKAARLEVLHQIDRWGEVEDSHDTDREELTRQLGACACVMIKAE